MSLWLAIVSALLVMGSTWWVPVTVDEAWLLVVARRVMRGERLYRDVFYGAAPLAVWILAAAFRVLRPQVAVMRAIGAVYAGVEVWAAVTLVDVAGGSAVARVGTALLVIGLGGPHLFLHNHYGRLTSAAILCAAAGMATGHPVAAGAAAGVAILNKYPQGLAATLTGLVALGWSAGVSAAAEFGAAAGAVVVGAALVLGPDLGWFYRRAVLNKRTYVRTGAMSPRAWMRVRPAARGPARAHTVIVLSAVVTVMVALPVGAAVTMGSGSMAVRAAVLVVAVSSVTAALPRFDGPHAVGAAPLGVAAIAAATAVMFSGPGLAWLMIAAGGPATVTGLAARVLMTRRARHRRDVPSMQLLPVMPLWRDVWPDATEDLPVRVIVIRPDAAMFYAAGGLTNPTPFDYPMASTFGVSGQSVVLATAGSGVPVLVAWPRGDRRLAPTVLLEKLENMVGEEHPVGNLVTVAGR